MSTRHANILPGIPSDLNVCSFCGKPHWSGEWRGSKLTLACRECAHKILPALYADATWYPAWATQAGEYDLALFQSEYWKAQAINASRMGGAHDPAQ